MFGNRLKKLEKEVSFLRDKIKTLIPPPKFREKQKVYLDRTFGTFYDDHYVKSNTKDYLGISYHNPSLHKIRIEAIIISNRLDEKFNRVYKLFSLYDLKELDGIDEEVLTDKQELDKLDSTKEKEFKDWMERENAENKNRTGNKKRTRTIKGKGRKDGK